MFLHFGDVRLVIADVTVLLFCDVFDEEVSDG